MSVQIVPYAPEHLEPIVQLSLRAWAPVFVSIEATMDPELYAAFYPDWRVTQRKAVEDACASDDLEVWVARDADQVAGFVALKLDREESLGEIYMIAVDPDFQRRGIAGALLEFALARMKEAGISMAMVETGADPGHAPARAAYEKLGFGLWPAARYFKKL